MKKPVKIAVMSDLHIGYGARAKDLSPYADSKAIETDYKKIFLAFIKKQKIKADYLVITGDISDRAQPSEFNLASGLIKEVAKELKVALKHVLFIPGNHDVDWAELSIADTTGFRRKQRYAPLSNKEWIFSKIMRAGKKDLLLPPHFCVWELEDIIAVGYNSAWHDDPSITTHHGLIADEHLRELNEYLSAITLPDSKLRVFLVHHHPVQYSDPIADEPDFSAMTNAEKLLTTLRSKHFDLLIHGHKHVPNFKTHIIDSEFPLVILGSGSFSAQMDTRWSGLVNNQFHVITIDGRDTKNQCINGFLESWTYICGRGWKPSDISNGIRHKLLFGTYILPYELLSTLRPIIKTRLETRDYITWQKLLSEIPDLANLKYLLPGILIEVLDTLAIELSFHRHGDSADEIVLLKEVT